MKRRFILSGLAMAVGLVFTQPSLGAAILDMQNVPDDMEPLVRSLRPKHGTFNLGEGLATLTTPKGFSYLPPDQTSILLNQVIGFVGEIPNLGSLVPDKIKLGSPATWAAVITYRADGHLSTDSLKTADPLYLLQELTNQTNDRNVKLSQVGLVGGGIDLIGWASKPYYDEQAHAFYWGLETQERGSKMHMLTYFLNIPGRRGTIAMTISADFELLPMVQGNAKPLLGALHFNQPNRYEDFDPKHDEQAGYTATDAILGHMHIKQKVTPSEPSEQVMATAPKRVKAIILILLLSVTLMAIRAKWYNKKP